jgi:hypothetical protein
MRSGNARGVVRFPGKEIGKPMTLDELLGKYEPALAAAFRQAIEDIKSGIVLRVVVDRLECQARCVG